MLTEELQTVCKRDGGTEDGRIASEIQGLCASGYRLGIHGNVLGWWIEFLDVVRIRFRVERGMDVGAVGLG